MRELFLTFLLYLVVAPVLGQEAFDAGRASFSVGLNNEIYPYREFASFVLPGERIVLRIVDESGASFSAAADAGNLERTAPGRYVWVAPQAPGRVAITVNRIDGDSIRINAFVQVPAARVRNGVLNGYELGRYPRPPTNDPIYAVPDGYIEINEEDLAVPVSPHFVLGQFVSDRGSVFPKYIVLRERLVLKLEALLERVNRDIRADSFAILSGYRSPARNQEVGGSPHSRHIYGGAAAIIVDRDPIDGVMDDLDSDGEITRRDAEVMLRIANTLFREPGLSYLQGGLAVYGPTSWRGPYLHVDARGYRARWNADQDLQRLANPRQPRHPRDFRRP
ncbi:MAG TPA: D-Ala-D-Ala carboxypeptidase family metallohydrolase [Gammaproteobacteria bacterium]